LRAAFGRHVAQGLFALFSFSRKKSPKHELPQVDA
jgi:hypothetical protein